MVIQTLAMLNIQLVQKTKVLMKKYFFISVAILVFNVKGLLAQSKLEIIKGFDSLMISEKTIQEANKAFEIIRNAPITLSTCKQKANNCENRAEFGNFVLNKLGFKPINFWIFKEGLIDGYTDIGGLEWDTGTKECKTLYWKYHVAAGIIITTDKGSDTLVYDPWTQGKLTTLRDWSLSFYKPNSARIVFAFPVIDNYFYFPTTPEGKLIITKEAWQINLDIDANQMYCGLCGITPNRKCKKNRLSSEIRAKRETIVMYLKDNGIN